jgi:dephospho-CoA kinase
VKEIILLAGHKGSGKTTVAEYLVDNYKARRHSLGEIIEQELTLRGQPITPAGKAALGNEMRATSPSGSLLHYCARSIGAEEEISVIDSAFALCDVETFRTLYSGGRLWYVEASRNMRVQRIAKRGRPDDDFTAESLHAFELAQHPEVDALATYADSIITNTGNKKTLYVSVDALLRGHV